MNIYLRSQFVAQRERNDWQSTEMIKCYECSLCICAQGSTGLYTLKIKTGGTKKNPRHCYFHFNIPLHRSWQQHRCKPIASKPVWPQVQVKWWSVSWEDFSVLHNIHLGSRPALQKGWGTHCRVLLFKCFLVSENKIKTICINQPQEGISGFK